MKLLKDTKLAQSSWSRYKYGLERGHLDYQAAAKRCEDFYFGAGLQWEESVKQALESVGRPWQEENIIFSVVNTVLGYQTQSRMDISYKPREVDDQPIADILTKLGMYIVDKNQYPWKESQVFADGIIQRRGYFDIRMDFNENLNGDIIVTTPDPLDVIPDPDAKDYDPEGWSDVLILNWTPVTEIGVRYGEKKMREVQANIDRYEGESDFGEEEGVSRNKFGLSTNFLAYDGSEDPDGGRVRVIERQRYVLTKRDYLLNPETGELTTLADGLSTLQKKKLAKLQGKEFITRVVRRVRWTVTTKDTVLHDAWSPYDAFTIIPYYPFFRRGRTVGLVDNLIKTQEMINKIFSQVVHVVNTTANSGWMVQQDSLTNMEVEDLEAAGSVTGLVLEYRTGREKPEKITPNSIPMGLKDIVETGIGLIRTISGVSETFQGGRGPEVSGTAIQSRVHQSAVQLATPLDALFRTRNLVAERVLCLIQQFYTTKRSLLITESKGGEQVTNSVSINDPQENGETLNDVTVGKYDVVIADVPTQVTFQNSQFQQGLDMRKFGIAIPDVEMIKLSTLARKNEIVSQMDGSQEIEALKQEYEGKMVELEEKIKNLMGLLMDKTMDNQKKAAEVATLLLEDPRLEAMMGSVLVHGNMMARNKLERLKPSEEQPTTEEQLGQSFPEEKMQASLTEPSEVIPQENIQ